MCDLRRGGRQTMTIYIITHSVSISMDKKKHSQVWSEEVDTTITIVLESDVLLLYQTGAVSGNHFVVCTDKTERLVFFYFIFMFNVRIVAHVGGWNTQIHTINEARIT